MGSMDKSGAYFHKTVGVRPQNTPDEKRRAVQRIRRQSRDDDDLRQLLDEIGLTLEAEGMKAKELAV